MKPRPVVLRLAVAAAACLAGVAGVALAAHHESTGAAAIDWAAVADEETVTVLTTDEDGSARETKIWLLVQEGNGYIRTSKSTTWGDNAERNPEIGLRIGETDHEFRAVFVTDEAERTRIVAGFEEKYGRNILLDWIRGSDPRIMRLDPR